jgi:quercetin dioxygenase-like cupin family protein
MAPGVAGGGTLTEERSMSSEVAVTRTRWEEVENEQLTELLQRRMITGERIMLAQIHLEKGCVVPTHSHENEQMSYILRGRICFWSGGEEKQTIVSAGEVLHLPSNIPHRAEALEDTLSLDVFSPPRQDWLDGTDDYLRGKR